jgi:hypothetical protein
VTPEHLAILVLAALVTVAAVVLVAQFRSGLARWKRTFQTLSTLFTTYSMPDIAALLQDLVVGDLPAFCKECEYLVRTLSNPASAATLLNKVLVGELAGALSDPGRAPAVVKVIQSWIAANAAAAAAAGLASTTPAT